jgi:hypothetical protein
VTVAVAGVVEVVEAGPEETVAAVASVVLAVVIPEAAERAAAGKRLN